MPYAPPTAPSAPKSYPRPPLLNSPVKSRWGVGSLTVKQGEVYIGQMGGGQKNVPVSAFDTQGAFASLSPPAQKALYKQAGQVYGYENVPQVNMDSFLSTTVRNAYAVQQTTGLLVDPLSYWDYYKTTGGPGLKDFGAADAAGGAGGGGGGGPRTTRSVSESVNLADPSTARGLIDATISQYLGRNPTDTEYANFTAALNAAQKKNPSITQSVTTSGVGTSSSRSVTKGGMDEAQFAREYAQSQEGVAELSAATTGLDSFIDAIGGF